MHPRLTELLEYAEAQRAVLLAAVDAVPAACRDRRPAPDAWSVAEVLEHLHRTERQIARLLRHRLAEARAAGLGPEEETGSLLGSLDAFRLPERLRAVRAPEFVAPRGELTSTRAVVALAESRQALLAAVAAGDGLVLSALTEAHPMLGPLTLYQWLLFVGQHEARHASQVCEIGQRLTAV